MSTLYRDYRPQKFSEVLGQNHIKITLQNEIVAGRPAGAYLFCGPRAVGKTTLARVLAKAVNCEKRKPTDSEPCNNCPSCQSIVSGKNLEVIEIDAASNTGVDNVRDNIIAFSRLSPTSAKYKVFIIDEVHMLSISAFNALLKIVEEPPAYVIFVLCTTEIQKVPATIVSRCERFDFRRVSVADIVQKLSLIAKQEKISVAEGILEAVARRSGGHLRDAESLLGQIFSLGDKKITVEQAELVMPHFNSQEAVNFIDYLGKKDAARAVQLINGLADSGVNIKIFVNESISLLRKLLLGKLSPNLESSLGLDWGEELEKKLGPLAANLSIEQIIAFTRRLMEVASDNKNPLIPQLPLEIAVGELCLGFSERKSEPASPKPSALKTEPKPVVRDKSIPVEPESAALRNDLTIETVLAKWPELLVKIKKYNHSLSFVLQNCEPREITEGRLNLVFKYKFHQDRINDQNIKPLVSQVMAEVFGPGAGFVTTLDEKMTLKKTESADSSLEESNPEADKKPEAGSSGLMSDLLKTFGGEVIN